MKMIIGGAYQGQIAWAQSANKDLAWIDGSNCPLDGVYSCQGIINFHLLIKRMLQQDLDFSADIFADALIRSNPDLVIVTNEIGYGLVPVDPFERIWREVTGRICTLLAACSEEVTRVVMGIGNRIK